MHNLTKSYNRKYYRQIALIRFRSYWRKAKISICCRLMRFAYKTDPVTFTTIVRGFYDTDEW